MELKANEEEIESTPEVAEVEDIDLDTEVDLDSDIEE